MKQSPRRVVVRFVPLPEGRRPAFRDRLLDMASREIADREAERAKSTPTETEIIPCA